jgi:hypothetical protein
MGDFSCLNVKLITLCESNCLALEGGLTFLVELLFCTSLGWLRFDAVAFEGLVHIV